LFYKVIAHVFIVIIVIFEEKNISQDGIATQLL